MSNLSIFKMVAIAVLMGLFGTACYIGGKRTADSWWTEKHVFQISSQTSYSGETATTVLRYGGIKGCLDGGYTIQDGHAGTK